LAALRSRYRLGVLEPVAQDGRWHVRGELQRVMAETRVTIDDEELGSVEEEIQAVFSELQGSPTSAAGEIESQRVAAEEARGRTRLSPSSASSSRVMLHEAINQVVSADGRPNATLEDAKQQAHDVVDRKLDQALAATDADKIFQLITSAQTEVNRLLKEPIVAVTLKKPGFAQGLETHHHPEVSVSPGTNPKEFRKRVDVPEKWRAEIEAWARQVVGTIKSKKQREQRRKAYVRQLTSMVRDSLTENKADQPHRSRAVADEVEMFVVIQSSHRAHHRRSGSNE
jgi:hypothetical protein